MKPTMLTLFAGGGLADEGLRGLVKPVGAVEYDAEIAGQFLTAHDLQPLVEDVANVDFSWFTGVDYIHASPVCKNFSKVKSLRMVKETGSVKAGTAIDMHTARGVVRAIETCQPKIFSLENAKEYADSPPLKLIRAALERNGYEGDDGIYQAADYGTPSLRERYLLRAWKKGLPNPATPQQQPRVGWYSVVKDLVPEFTPSALAPWQLQRLPKNLKSLPIMVMGGSGFKGSIPFSYADQPAPTIKATPNEGLPRIVMPDGSVLKMNYRSLARVMGVPDLYPLPTKAALAQTILGNGVPPPLALAVFGPLVEGLS